MTHQLEIPFTSFETEYKKLVQQLLSEQGAARETRNAKTISTFGVQLKAEELRTGVFPIVRGRKIYWKGVVGELAAFLKGPRSVQDFTDVGCNFWSPWAKKNKLELDYGNAWIDFNGTNQLLTVVQSLRTEPYSRRHLISAWRPDRLEELSLPCCHYAYQWYVTNDGYLDMAWIQRSVDIMVGMPSDIVSAALFNILMAQTVGLKPGKITFQLGDTHLYLSHAIAAHMYVAADESTLKQPTWSLDPAATVFNFHPEMFSIDNYEHYGPIPLEVIV